MEFHGGNRGGQSSHGGSGGRGRGNPRGRGRGDSWQGSDRGGYSQGRGRGDSSQGSDRGGYSQGRGRGDSSQGSDRGGYSQGRGRGNFWQGSDRGGYSQGPGRGRGRGGGRGGHFQGQSQEQSRDSNQGRDFGRGPEPQRSDHGWSSNERSFSSVESVAQSASSTWGIPSSSFTETAEQLQRMKIDDEVTGPSEQMSQSSTDTREELTAGETKEPAAKRKRNKKGKKEQSSESKSQSTEEPQPSTSAQASGAGAGSATGPQKSKTDNAPPVDSKYNDVPKRRKQGPIHVGSDYFYEDTTTIEVNYLPIEFSNKNMKIYHYDIEVGNANKEDTRLLVNIMRQRCFPKRHPAFDGKKNLYAAKDPLFDGKSKSETIKITRPNGKDKEYRVTVTKAAENVELTIATLYQYMEKNGCSTNRPQATIQAIEVAIRGNLPDRFVNCGRAFYTRPQQSVNLSAGLELYSGFMQGAVLGQKPFVNVDVSHRGFYTPKPLLQYLEHLIEENSRQGQADYSQLDKGLSQGIYGLLSDYVKQNNGLKMRYIDPRTKSARTYKIKGVGQDARRAIFQLTEGDKVRPISVYDYFRTAKQYTIRYPNLPVIEAGSKGDFFPLECCSIEERQPVQNRYKYSGDETRAMIANCKDLPEGRKRKILDSIRTADFNRDPVLGEFGVTIGERGNTNQFLKVTAASLLSPQVLYRDGYGDIQNGVWNMKRFVATNRITDWIIVNMNRFTKDFEIKKLEELLTQNAGQIGMEMARAKQTMTLQRSDERDIEQYFRDLKSKNPNLQLVFVILPGGSSSFTDTVYRRVKYVSEIQIGLLTQCIKPSPTLQRVSWMTARNILLKINSKLSGINHVMQHPKKNAPIFDGSTMFVGADVNHPAPGPNQKNERSVCAVAGSYDEHGSKYKMLYSIQQSCEEMIQDMEKMVRALLVFFSKKNGKFPTKMYYYRDGVSDGQFSKVLHTEMTAIRMACEKLGANVKVAFVVVQKRHHTRFFPPRQRADKKGNVFAGTVVNTTITHPTEHDFYLVSHQSIQGTARPTKYHVLYDEIREPEDYVEALTYYLCYMFVRCTRSVSYPAPTYYAHLAAARAEKYIKCVKENHVTPTFPVIELDVVSGSKKIEKSDSGNRVSQGRH